MSRAASVSGVGAYEYFTIPIRLADSSRTGLFLGDNVPGLSRWSAAATEFMAG